MNDVYIRVRPLATVFDSRELVEGEVIADFGPDGELIGVEVLTATGVRVDGNPATAIPADDDVPVTAEWAEPLLEIVDSEGVIGGWWRSRGVSNYGSVEVWYEAGRDYLKILANRATYYASTLDHMPPTCGQFRRLCAAFDIPLKGTK